LYQKHKTFFFIYEHNLVQYQRYLSHCCRIAADRLQDDQVTEKFRSRNLMVIIGVGAQSFLEDFGGFFPQNICISRTNQQNLLHDICQKIFLRFLGGRGEAFAPIPVSYAYMTVIVTAEQKVLSPIHTADADETKLSSLVASASAVCT